MYGITEKTISCRERARLPMEHQSPYKNQVSGRKGCDVVNDLPFRGEGGIRKREDEENKREDLERNETAKTEFLPSLKIFVRFYESFDKRAENDVQDIRGYCV